jgi:LPXTG-motif cell wall-anchored protein
MRKALFSVACAVLLTLGSAGAAMAADEPGDPGVYAPPPPPPTPSLVGSTADAVCVDDVPMITYSVLLTDPGDLATGHTAVLVITDGVNRVDVTLGDVSSGPISGSVLWPGASVDAAGNGNGWPGWVFRDGAWVETSGNYGWTRGAVSATIQVNPEMPVVLAYPPASSGCAAPTITGTALSARSAPLAATGGQTGVVMTITGIAVGAVVLGGVVLLARRRRV